MVLLERARAPVAVLFVPLSLASRAKKPMAVLNEAAEANDGCAADQNVKTELAL